MSTNFIDEYLLKLGAVVDQSGLQRFHQALREASSVADASATGIAGSFLKAQTEIVAGFVAIGGAALGLVDKVAMADQQYRLFALHMYMSKDAARSLKVAMDALGEPLENLTWDKELNERTRQLIADQRAMAPDGDFEGQMRKVRDIRFEFTRMEVEGQYLAMHVVQDFMKALGFGPDELLTKLKGFNDWVTHSLPQISAKIVTLFMPVWADVKDVIYLTVDALKEFGLAFTNIVGALSGDTSIEDKRFNFEKFADAIAHVVHWLAGVAEFADTAATAVAALTAAFAKLTSVIPAPILDAGIGAAAGGYFGGPWGAAGGAVLGGGFGLWNKYHPSSDAQSSGAPPSSMFSSAHALVSKYAAQFGVDVKLANALVAQESGGDQSAVSSTGATGIMQLTRGTAAALGVDREDADQNVEGGMRLLAHLMQRYGDAPTAIAAYHEGEPKMNAVLSGQATLSPEARGEVAAVMARMGVKGNVTVGPTTIHITQQPGESNTDLARRIVDKQNMRTQRNLQEFQDWSPSY